jgi:hypothetical protein
MATRAKESFNYRSAIPYAASLLLVAISIALLIPRLRNWPVTPDFTMLWAGARIAVTRPHDTYDWAAVTAAQMNLRPPVGPLPFPYPPSALPLMAPFGLLPSLAGVLALDLLVSRSLLDRGAANHFSSALRLHHAADDSRAGSGPDDPMDRCANDLGRDPSPDAARDWGLLFGVIAAIKPQFAILVPVALIAGRHWLAIAGSAGGLAAMLLLSLPFGSFLWHDWASVLGEHPAIVSSYGLNALRTSPMMALKLLGLPLYLHVIFVGRRSGWCGARSVPATSNCRS